MEATRTTDPQLPALPCPECRENGSIGGARIGNNRRKCRTCNNFVSNVTRLLGQRLRENHPDEAATLRLSIERDLYEQAIEQYTRRAALR